MTDAMFKFRTAWSSLKMSFPSITLHRSIAVWRNLCILDASEIYLHAWATAKSNQIRLSKSNRINLELG